MKCNDKDYYGLDKKDVPDKCFLCGQNSGKLFIVRQVKNMKMVHLCPSCMINNPSDFLLDNTRPWKGDKAKLKKLIIKSEHRIDDSVDL
jgi:hypothetical protein